MERRAMAASVAALGGVLAMITCCLPLPFLAAAAATAGLSTIAGRWWLMPASLALLGYGFYQTYACRRCSRPSVLSQVVLWTCAAIVLGLLLFPQWIAVTVVEFTSR